MKRLTFIFLGFAVLALMFFAACNKNTQNTDKAPVTITDQQGFEKALQISKDADWLILAANNLKIVNALVESDIDIEKLDFTNEAAFAQALRLTKYQYNELVATNRSASERLSKRYGLNLSDASSGYTCASCTTTDIERIAKIKSSIHQLRGNPERLAKFKKLLSPDAIPVEVAAPGDDGEIGGAGCGFWFYVCAAGCGLGTGPAAAACVLGCYLAFC